MLMAPDATHQKKLTARRLQRAQVAAPPVTTIQASASGNEFSKA
jgi:hypothetical protein